jgi:hypothetical protein
MKMCSECGKNPKMDKRRVCHRCYLDRRKKQYYNKGGEASKKRYGKSNCKLCGSEIKLGKPTQKYCWECSVKISKISTNSTNNYQYSGNSETIWEHQVHAEKLLERKLKTHEVVHHCNGDPKDNKLSNLILISKTQHGRLHQFIKEQRALMEKSINEQDENCWKTLIAQMTTTWLETANVKVKKLSEIGQSAGEPLNTGVDEEASEAMHVPPKA